MDTTLVYVSYINKCIKLWDFFYNAASGNEKNAPIPMALAIGAINSRLTDLGIRGFASINVQTGEVLDTHSFAVLLGVGATTVNPYIAFDSIYQRF